MAATQTHRSVKDLPKAHLHLHLAQAMRTTTAQEWALEDGIPSPRVGSFPDFAEFLNASAVVTGLLTSPERVRRLIYEAIEDAGRDGTPILELSFSPPLYAKVFGDPESALHAMTAYADEASERFGVWTGLIIGIDRHAGPEPALNTAKLAARFAEAGVVGLGLYGDERAFAAEAFTESFRIGKEAGLLSVPHAGELVGPESIWAALDALQADRVQHGVTAVRDAALLERLAETGVCLDVCPTSNVALDVIPSLADHPLPELLRAGVRCSINADDPTLFGPGIADEYDLARQRIGLDDDDLAACARSAIEASAAPPALKVTALAGVQSWLRS
jgi:adenosine deaminase